MRDRNHTKFQLFYIEKDGRFKLFMFLLAGVIYYSKVDIRDYRDTNSFMNFESAIDIFKRSYLNDGIKVEKILISDVKEYDKDAPIIEELEGEEYNTNDIFNTEQQEHEIPDQTRGEIPSLEDMGIKT